MPIKDSAFWTGVLATVPEAERGKVEARIIEMEESGMRQSDYSKVVAEAREAEAAAKALLTQNQQWWEAHKDSMTELDTLRAKVTSGTTTATGGDSSFKLPEDVITVKSLTDRLTRMEREAVGYITESQMLTLKHFKDFGEVLNVNELVTDPRAQQIGIQGVYNEKFKEQIAAKLKAADDAKAEAFRVEGEKRAMERMASQRGPGYPVTGNEPSSLDALEAARASGTKVSETSVDQMAAEFARLSAARMGSSP
jgi:hypothetical protein